MASNSTRAKAAAALAASLLIGLEGYGAKPYLDSAKVLTDCYGNTHNVVQGKIRTKVECAALLEGETGKLATMIAADSAYGTSLNQIAATVSWTYNVGAGAYSTSTLRKKLKAGDFKGACLEMYRWNLITVGGVKVELPGLNNRREKEVKLCLTPDSPSDVQSASSSASVAAR